MAVKVAVIGAGSITFTRRLARDILTVPELQDTHGAFTDINARKLRMAAALCAKAIRAKNVPPANSHVAYTNAKPTDWKRGEEVI